MLFVVVVLDFCFSLVLNNKYTILFLVCFFAVVVRIVFFLAVVGFWIFVL